MKLYKLTDEKGITYGNTQWGANVTYKLKKTNDPQLCSSNVIHAYKNKNLAYLLNPIHGDYDNPRIYEARGEVVVEDYGKVGCFELTTVKELKPPGWLDRKEDVQVMFAVLCAEAALHLFEGKSPADNRPRKAIEAAKKYLKTHNAADAADAADAAYAAFAAFAAYAAGAAGAAGAADAAFAAYAAANAADATYAAGAAFAAFAVDADIGFGELADKAVKYITTKEKG